MRAFYLYLPGLLLWMNARSQMTIAAAKAAPVGSTVTVKGIVTTAAEHGINFRFFQDGTAGMAVYNGTASVPGFTAVTRGDSVTITGPTVLYFNLFEINPVQGFTIHASGRPLPPSATITPSSFTEPVEGQLITIQNCSIQATGNFAPVSASYTVSSAGQTFELRVPSTATTIAGQPVPSGFVNITGAASQYCSSPPSGCTTGYQLLPRTMNDFAIVAGLNEFTKHEAISIFPNPANNILTFKIKQTEAVRHIIIRDNLGRVVTSVSENSNTVDISSLAGGIHSIFIITEHASYASRFCVAR